MQKLYETKQEKRIKKKQSFTLTRLRQLKHIHHTNMCGDMLFCGKWQKRSVSWVCLMVCAHYGACTMCDVRVNVCAMCVYVHGESIAAKNTLSTRHSSGKRNMRCDLWNNTSCAARECESASWMDGNVCAVRHTNELASTSNMNTNTYKRCGCVVDCRMPQRSEAASTITKQ